MARSRSESTVANARLRVVVVDEDPLAGGVIRDRLRADDILVVGEAHSGRDALRAARYYNPDVILLDAVLPDIDGITVLEQMVADDEIAGKVVIRSVRGERDLGYLALRKGAAGYLSKDLDLGVLPRVIRDVANGGAAISRTLAADLARRIHELPEVSVGMRPVKSTLTDREWEVLDYLCLGRSTSDIATALVLSTETVRTHIKNIMRKLNVHSRKEAVQAAERLRTGDSAPDGDGQLSPKTRSAVAAR